MHQFLNRLKQNLGIDFKNFKKYFFLETLFNYSLYQIRKLFSKEMNKKYGMVLQKSAKEYKIEGKDYYDKRDKGVFKDLFVKYPNSIVGKQKYNKFIEREGHDKLKLETDEVDPSKKQKLVGNHYEFIIDFMYFDEKIVSILHI